MNRVAAVACLLGPALLALGAAGAPAQAAGPAPYSVVQHDSFKDHLGEEVCDRSGTTVPLQVCALLDTLATDHRIDVTAGSIRRLRSDAAARRLDTAQRAWVSFRAAACASVADQHEGGSAAPVAGAQCLAAQSRTRLAQLQSQLRSLRRG